MTHHPENHYERLHGLDHLRAAAIIMVFLFHYYILSGGQPAWLPHTAQFGWTGVDLFFVLSGFLISSQLFAQLKKGQPISFKDFFIRRFFRIIPAYLVTVALYFCIPFFREKESLPPLWKFLTFTQNLGLNLKDNGTFSHCWSLCVEEHFYLFLPITLIFLYSFKLLRHSYWILIALFALGFIIRYISYNSFYLPQSDSATPWMYWYQFIYYPSYNRLDGLLAGVAIAATYQFLPKVRDRISRLGNVFIMLSLAILTAAYFLCEEQMTFNASVFGFPLIALGYGSMVLGAVLPGSFLYNLNSKITRFLATLSYAIYLTHKGVIHMTHKMLDGFNIEDNLMLFICVVTCIVFAWLLHQIVEKPFMQLRNKMIKRQPVYIDPDKVAGKFIRK